MEKHLSEMTLAELTREEGVACSCGKVHTCQLRYFRAESGAVRLVPEALAARGTRTDTLIRDYETQIDTDAKDMAKSTVRLSGGLVTGIIMGIVLYYMIRRGRQNAKEKAALKKEAEDKAAEKPEEAPENIEPPQVMYHSQGR